jgi:Domain of unknown function (DUF3523)
MVSCAHFPCSEGTCLFQVFHLQGTTRSMKGNRLITSAGNASTAGREDTDKIHVEDDDGVDDNRSAATEATLGSPLWDWFNRDESTAKRAEMEAYTQQQRAAIIEHAAAQARQTLDAQTQLEKQRLEYHDQLERKRKVDMLNAEKYMQEYVLLLLLLYM